MFFLIIINDYPEELKKKTQSLPNTEDDFTSTYKYFSSATFQTVRSNGRLDSLASLHHLTSILSFIYRSFRKPKTNSSPLYPTSSASSFDLILNLSFFYITTTKNKILIIKKN